MDELYLVNEWDSFYFKDSVSEQDLFFNGGFIMKEKTSYDKELTPERTTSPDAPLKNQTWDLGPSGGAKTGEVPGSIDQAPDAPQYH